MIIHIFMFIVLLFSLYYIIKSAVRDGIKDAYRELHMDIDEKKDHFESEQVKNNNQ